MKKLVLMIMIAIVSISFVNADGVDNYTKLMLHMDDSSLGDSSVQGHSVTKHGDVTVTSAESKFGGYSAYFDGSGDYLSIPDSEDWNFGDTFTIDFWVKLDGSWANTQLLNQHQDDANNWRLELEPWGAQFYVEENDDRSLSMYQESASGWATGNWYHVALVRDGNEWDIYRNGTSIVNATSSLSISNYNAGLHIGKGQEDDDNFPGYIDELRISKGIARWTSNFTPPSKPYGLPLASNFISFPSTTNFSAEPDLTNVTNLSIGTPWGQIQFPDNYSVNAEGEDYNRNVIFGDCFVAVNASALDYTFNATAYLLMNNSDGHCGDNTIFRSDGTVVNASDIKNDGKICKNCKQIDVGEDTVTFKIPHFSSYAIGSNSNLTIDANDPKLVNQTVTFTAVYRNSSSGDFISGANCEIELKGTTSAMNEGTDKYTYQTSFTENQTYSYNVTCSKAGYQQLKINDSFEILPTTEAVPEFSSIGILLLIFALISIYFFKTK